MNEQVIRWEDPPPRIGHPLTHVGPIRAFVEALRTRPGEWAILADDVPVSIHLNHTHYQYRDIQWRQVQNDDGATKRIYGRTKVAS